MLPRGFLGAETVLNCSLEEEAVLRSFYWLLGCRRQFVALSVDEAFSVDSSSGRVVLVHYEGGGERDAEILWYL